MIRLLLLLAGFAVLAFPTAAQEEKLADPAQEELAREIMKGIRCLVCQNQAVDESNAGLAKDIRQIIRERVAAGDNEDDVEAYLVARYGEWVLLKPPFAARTALLWLAPLLFIVAGSIGVSVFIRNRKRDPALAAAPLSAAEENRLNALMAGERDEQAS